LSAIKKTVNQAFLHYKRVRDGRHECAVQLIGIISEAFKYKCEFKLCAANGIEQISKICIVRSYIEDFDTTNNSGKSFCIDDVVVKNFVVDGEVNMTITLSEKWFKNCCFMGGI
jgi:hypothetical protein